MNRVLIDFAVVTQETLKINTTITYNIQPQRRSECTVNYATSNKTTQITQNRFWGIQQYAIETE